MSDAGAVAGAGAAGAAGVAAGAVGSAAGADGVAAGGVGGAGGADAAGVAAAGVAAGAVGSAAGAAGVAAGGVVVFARVSDTPITVEECDAAVASASAGAVVSFAGVVRDHDEGRGVLTLDYSAHPSAGDVIASVAATVAAEYPGVTIAVAHRVGSLTVGDIALACAVASAHRSLAFAACSRLVDAVKESVPIWKQQGFTDGSSEWVASLG